jgi:acyl-CoA thioester hydrolase
MNKISSSSTSMVEGKHRLGVRVYYENTDAGGIVYYADYLKFSERARTEMLRAIGCEQQDNGKNYGISFVVRTCNVEFFKPGKLDDWLEVVTEILMVRGASILMRQNIKKGNHELVLMEVKLACISSDGSPVRIPIRLRDRMSDLILLKGDG